MILPKTAPVTGARTQDFRTLKSHRHGVAEQLTVMAVMHALPPSGTHTSGVRAEQ